jgi:predicted NBD/HSP70 family sugar kinase
MQLDSHVQAIQQELAAAAARGDEQTAEIARRMGEALAATLHLHLLDLLGDAALEIGGQLESGRVEVRLAGREPELVVVADEVHDAGQVAAGEELSGRITLRLPESLKSGVEAAAALEGISSNAWLVRTIARSLDQRSAKRSRNRMQGYAQG